MRKKAQITVFIILGIILVIVAGTLFYIYQMRAPKAETEIESMPQTIKLYTQSCIQNIAEPGAYLLGQQGGFIFEYPNSVQTEFNEIAYHLDNNQEIGPTKEYMENEISEFAKKSLNICLNDFETFEGYNFSYGEIKAKTTINDKDIQIEIDYPIEIRKGNKITSVSKFSDTIKIKLGDLLNKKTELISDIKKEETINPEQLTKYGKQVNLYPYNKNTLIYSIVDEPDSQKFTFNFAVKTDGNTAPRLDFVPDFVVAKGKQFTYQLNATDPDGDEITYFSKDSDVNVDSITGFVLFNPAQTENKTIEFCASDPYNETNCRTAKLMIK